MAHKKLRILYLARYLQERSDEEHPVGVGDMIAYLEGLGIPAERKALYDDLELLAKATATTWASGLLNWRSSSSSSM